MISHLAAIVGAVALAALVAAAVWKSHSDVAALTRGHAERSEPL